MDIDKEVDILIPELGIRLNDALPTEHRQVLDDYIFLTLFHALEPYTSYGMAEVERLVKRYRQASSQRTSSH